MLILVASICLLPLVLVTLYLYVSGVFTNRRTFQLGSSPISRTVDLRVVPVVVVFRGSDADGDNKKVCTVVNDSAEGKASLTIQSSVPKRKGKGKGS